MPKLGNQTPKYRRHRASGQARVTISGRDTYLGPYGTAASRREYDRVVGEWLANGRQAPLAKAADYAIVELIAGYWQYARDYYRPGPDCSDGELDGIRLALAVVKRLYADTFVVDFGPLALKVVRDAMVAQGWSRTYINAQIGRVRRAFKWGVENELVPPGILHGLQAVAGLRYGKTVAKETYHRWTKQYRGAGADEVRLVTEFEKENARLKATVAERELHQQILSWCDPTFPRAGGADQSVKVRVT